MIHFDKMGEKPLEEFANENTKFKMGVGDLKFDFSRNFIDVNDVQNFQKNIKNEKIFDKIDAFFDCNSHILGYGSVSWHHVFRNIEKANASIFKKEAAHYLEDCFELCEKIHTGKILGAEDKPIKTVLNIGIGGSDLGVRLGNYALKDDAAYDIEVYHLNQPDQFYINNVLDKVDFSETLVVYTSRGFNTLDMLSCLDYVRTRFESVLGSPDVLKKQFIAVTANEQAAIEHGFAGDRIVKMPAWIGGRYSISSPAGFSFILKLGKKNYLKFLEGMAEIDLSFQDHNLFKNPALFAAFIEFHYIKNFSVRAQAFQVYDNRLWDFCAYYQQLYMESLGKKIPDPKISSNIIFGGLGIKGQHAYYQTLHEGNQLIPIEFIVKTKIDNVMDKTLFANAVAQSQALMQRNRPMNIITYKRLTPKILGQLIAYCEHKVFALAQLMNINPFDQPGVELGKAILKEILPIFDDKKKIQKCLGNVTKSFFDLCEK